MKGRVNILLFGIPIILAGFGLVLIYSASAIIAYETFGTDTYFLVRQFIWLILGVALMLIVMNIDYKIYKTLGILFMIFSFLILAMVLVPGLGRKVGGAQRWLKVLHFQFQPSELVKLFVVIYFARILSDEKFDVNNLKEHLLPALLLLIPIVALILFEQDLGTALIILVVIAVLLFYAGLKYKYIFALVVAALPMIYFLIVKVPYRLKRIQAFINPWKYSHGSGFQIIQSLLSLGSGGIWGVGLGNGKSKLFYLPAPHTDFIFSVIGEELGFIGAVAIIILYLILILNCLKLAKDAQDNFAKYLALGISLLIGIQVLINIGVVLGLLPTKGITLPFISFGGSSLVFNFIGIGILLNISRSVNQ